MARKSFKKMIKKMNEHKLYGIFIKVRCPAVQKIDLIEIWGKDINYYRTEDGTQEVISVNYKCKYCKQEHEIGIKRD